MDAIFAGSGRHPNDSSREGDIMAEIVEGRRAPAFTLEDADGGQGYG
jgi:hypothetical protein